MVKEKLAGGKLLLAGDLLHRALKNGDGCEVQRILEEILARCSFWSFASSDNVPENAYTMLVFAVLEFARADTTDAATYHTEMEAGLGRVDIICIPGSKGQEGCILELKRLRKGATTAALAQIDNKRYREAFRKYAPSVVYEYGIAFDRKTCVVAMRKVAFNDIGGTLLLPTTGPWPTGAQTTLKLKRSHPEVGDEDSGKRKSKKGSQGKGKSKKGNQGKGQSKKGNQGRGKSQKANRQV